MAQAFLEAEGPQSPALCMDCQGYGTRSWHGEIQKWDEKAGRPENVCPACDLDDTRMGTNEYGRGYCERHRCRRCDGKGVICPRCHGMRFLRKEMTYGDEAVRCDFCCEGNNVSPSREMQTITARWERLEAGR